MLKLKSNDFCQTRLVNQTVIDTVQAGEVSNGNGAGFLDVETGLKGEKHLVISDFEKKDTIYFGIELEFNAIDGLGDAIREALDDLDRDKERLYGLSKWLFTTKYDGSLSYGLELAFKPMTLKAYIYLRYCINDILNTVLEYYDSSCYSDDYELINNGTGFHVHFNRGGLRCYDTDTFKFVYLASILENTFFNNCGRDDLCDDYYFKRIFSNCPHPLSDSKKLLSSLLSDADTSINDMLNNHLSKIIISRYQWLNLTNYSTIELRIFQSTTDFKVIENALYAIEKMVRLANHNSLLDLVKADNEEITEIVFSHYNES